METTLKIELQFKIGCSKREAETIVENYHKTDNIIENIHKANENIYETLNRNMILGLKSLAATCTRSISLGTPLA